ncbi:hypothetical protein BS50DRAFT_453529, partial [Corynespora cassiicola Philippines]
LCIAVYAALPDDNHSPITDNGVIGYIGFLVIVAQFTIAGLPILRYNDWGVILITSFGTFLVQTVGALPQWRVEKLLLKRSVTKYIAITSGNGPRHVMIVMGSGNAIDLEQLASPIFPRSSRAWEKIRFFSYLKKDIIGYWITLLTLSVQTHAWRLTLLISVAGIKMHTWYLLSVDLLGMFQNALIAEISRDPRKRHLPLTKIDFITTTKVMDGLMDLEVTFTGFGRSLIGEFFPGELKRKEKQWWE